MTLEQLADDVANALDDAHGFSVREHAECKKLVLAAVQAATSQSWQETLKSVTRLEVIGPQGREWSRWHLSLEPSLQDRGLTLKLFYRPEMPNPRLDLQ